MNLSDQDAESLQQYDEFLEELTVKLDAELKGAQSYVEYARKFLQLFLQYDQSTDPFAHFFAEAMLVISFPTIAYFFLYRDDDLPSTRNIFCNLITVIFNVAVKRKARIDGNVLEEMEVLLATFHNEDVQNRDCLEQEEITKMIHDWNTINNIPAYFQKYLDKWELEWKGDGVSWNETYGFFVALYLYLANGRPKRTNYFIDRDIEYILFGLIVHLNKQHLTMHPYFLEKIYSDLAVLKTYAY